MSSQYFPPYRGHVVVDQVIADVKVRLDLTNYATKADLKKVTHIDKSSFALKTNVANLKTEVDKLDIDILKLVSNDLAKSMLLKMMLSNKKTEYYKNKIS